MRVGILSQQVKIYGPLRIAAKNDLLRVPALRNMMWDIHDHDACKPSHTQKLPDRGWRAEGNRARTLIRDSHIGKEN